MRPATLAMALLCGVAACRASQTPHRTGNGTASAGLDTASGLDAASPGLDIAYGVDAARPRTSFDLHIPPVGDAELYLGASLSTEGTDTLGYFRAPLAPETRAALASLAQQGNLLSRSDGPSVNAEGSGFLRLTSGDDKADVSLIAADRAVTALRAKLDEVVAEVARHPVRALRLTLEATREGAAWRPELTLTQIGTEPLSVLFFDPASPAFWLRATASAGTNGPASTLARSDVEALVQKNALPGGVSDAAPGAVFSVVLGALGAPDAEGSAVELSGSVTFWLAGPGLARRPVELRARTTAQ